MLFTRVTTFHPLLIIIIHRGGSGYEKGLNYNSDDSSRIIALR